MATQQTKDGLGYIIQAISNIVEPKMETLKYDKTYRAKVTQKIDVGVYNVQINGTSYKLSYSGTLNVGDIVRVKAPLNNFSDIYIEPLPGSGGGGTGGTTNYNDLTNKPIINSTYSTAQSTNNSEILKGTIALHKISKTGNYNDLLNKPSLNFIPTSQKGAADGVASLGADKIVPKSELPTDVVYDSNYKHITIENVLNSTSTTNALSANQGKVLNDKINALKIPSVVDNLTSTSATDALSANQGKVLAGRISDNDTMITNLQEDIILAEDNITEIKKDYIPLTQKGYANGVATLGADSIIPKSQLPANTVYDTNYKHIDVEDNLTSSSSDNALSANQGKILASRIEQNDTMITTLQEDIIQAEDNITEIKRDYIPLTQKGYANGVASLDINAKILPIQLPIATTTTLGAFKIGKNLTIDEDGTLNATGGGVGSNEVEISEDTPTDSSVELWVDLNENSSYAEIQDKVEKNQQNIGTTSDTYDKTKTYAVDEIVVQNGLLYKCKTAVTTAEEFDSSKWEQISILDSMLFFVKEGEF